MAKKKIDVAVIIGVAIGIFTIILQIFPPKTPADKVNSILYFLAIIGYIFIFYIIDWFTKKARGYTEQINKNKEDIEKIQFHLIDKRLAILENKGGNTRRVGKKGYIDPKWIAVGILLLLFYLYLKSLGYLN